MWHPRWYERKELTLTLTLTVTVTLALTLTVQTDRKPEPHMQSIDRTSCCTFVVLVLVILFDNHHEQRPNRNVNHYRNHQEASRHHENR